MSAVCPCLIGSAIESALCTWLFALVVLTLPTIPNPTLLFPPFGRWGTAGRSFPFSKASLHGAVDGKPRVYFAFVNGNDCSAFLRSGNSPFPSVRRYYGLIPRPTDRYAIHRRLDSVSATTDTITVVFSFHRCVILSNNTLRTFAAPNDSIRKARAAIVSRS